MFPKNTYGLTQRFSAATKTAFVNVNRNHFLTLGNNSIPMVTKSFFSFYKYNTSIMRKSCLDFGANPHFLCKRMPMFRAQGGKDLSGKLITATTIKMQM